MFDGSYRTRREINLSGRNKQRNKTSRAQLLKQNAKLREERQLKQKKINASIKIQKYYRGFRSRRTIALCDVESSDYSTVLLFSMKLSTYIQSFLTLDMKKTLVFNFNKLESSSTVCKQRVLNTMLEIFMKNSCAVEEEKSNEIVSSLLKDIQQYDIIAPNKTKLYLCLRLYFWSSTKSSALTLSLLQMCYVVKDELQLALIYFSYGNILQHPLYPSLQIKTIYYLQLLTQNLQMFRREISNQEIWILFNASQLVQHNTQDGAIILLRILSFALENNLQFRTWCSAAASGISFSSFDDSMDYLEVHNTTNKSSLIVLSSDSDSDYEQEKKFQSRTTAPRLGNSKKKDYVTPSQVSKHLNQEFNEYLKLYEAPSSDEFCHLIANFVSGTFLYQVVIVFASNTSQEEETEEWKNLYFQVLYHCLHGIYYGTSSFFSQPLLLQLAFPKQSTNILLELLSTSISTENIMAQVLFCEVFLCKLYPLRDEEFLKQYHDQLSIIVQWLSKECLYDLYYLNPIQLTENTHDSYSSSSQRKRLLLSGTKLYNALHERYSRIRTKFCTEEDWYFPSNVLSSWEKITPNESKSTVRSDENNNDDDLSKLLSQNLKLSRIVGALPQSIPFQRRVALFMALLQSDFNRYQQSNEVTSLVDFLQNPERAVLSNKVPFKIRRDFLVEDALKNTLELNSIKDLKKQVQVSFVNSYGAEEAGIDGGGVFKEFMNDLILEAFSPTAGFFDISCVELQTLVVSPTKETLKDLSKDQVIQRYLFLGRILGKAVYENIVIEPQLALPLLNQLSGGLRNNTLDDLKNLDVQLYQNLMQLRTMSTEDLQSLSLMFEYQGYELIPNGRNTAVTSDNVIRFLHLVANYKLNVHNIEYTSAFCYGFKEIISPSWIRLFSPSELQKLISGTDDDDDEQNSKMISNLKSVMTYGGGYHESQSYISLFWQVLEEFSAQDQKLFLKFMTSCSRAPLLGFSTLNPLPCVHQVRLENTNEEQEMKLPTSSTCINLLKLPNYGKKEILRKKLLYAIRAGAGFELS